jgi:hypothetical protein
MSDDDAWNGDTDGGSDGDTDDDNDETSGGDSVGDSHKGPLTTGEKPIFFANNKTNEPAN